MIAVIGILKVTWTSGQSAAAECCGGGAQIAVGGGTPGVAGGLEARLACGF